MSGRANEDISEQKAIKAADQTTGADNRELVRNDQDWNNAKNVPLHSRLGQNISHTQATSSPVFRERRPPKDTKLTNDDGMERWIY